jgi:hypothetical protein
VSLGRCGVRESLAEAGKPRAGRIRLSQPGLQGRGAGGGLVEDLLPQARRKRGQRLGVYRRRDPVVVAYAQATDLFG